MRERGVLMVPLASGASAASLSVATTVTAGKFVATTAAGKSGAMAQAHPRMATMAATLSPMDLNCMCPTTAE